MSRVCFITRADDLGSNISANKGVEKVCNAGFFKNASIMAPGPNVEHAAQLLAHRKDICFGMHITINSEWDLLKWRPLTNVGQKSGLVDDKGFFLNNPKLFTESKPDIDIIMNEVNAQLERLNKLGFNITYLDSHMLPEIYVDNLDDAIKEFAQKKGLLDHMYFYELPPGFMELIKNPSILPHYLKNLPEGQYFIVSHPAVYSNEMLQTGNSETSGEKVAKNRSNEAKNFSGIPLKLLLKRYGCTGIRYDEAKPQERMTVQKIKEVMQQIPVK